MRILVVEDEAKVAAFLRRALEEEGHAAEVAGDGEEGLTRALTGEYDLLILDHRLPGLSGLDLCRRVRAAGLDVPTLMVTARDAVEDRVAGLDAGADDYLPKPFALDELLARVRALLRRAHPGPSPLDATLTVDDLSLDSRTRQAVRGERRADLSAREFALLDYLMRNARRPVTRSMIAQHVWGFDFDHGSNVIDVYIRALRRKLDPDQTLIRTLRHVGYRLG